MLSWFYFLCIVIDKHRSSTHKQNTRGLKKNLPPSWKDDGEKCRRKRYTSTHTRSRVRAREKSKAKNDWSEEKNIYGICIYPKRSEKMLFSFPRSLDSFFLLLFSYYSFFNLNFRICYVSRCWYPISLRTYRSYACGEYMSVCADVFVHLSPFPSYFPLLHLSFLHTVGSSNGGVGGDDGGINNNRENATMNDTHREKVRQTNEQKKNEYGMPVGIYIIRLLLLFFYFISYMHMYDIKHCGRYSLIGYYDYFLCRATQLLYACVFLICVQAFKHFSFLPNQFREPKKKTQRDTHTHIRRYFSSKSILIGVGKMSVLAVDETTFQRLYHIFGVCRNRETTREWNGETKQWEKHYLFACICEKNNNKYMRWFEV